MLMNKEFCSSRFRKNKNVQQNDIPQLASHEFADSQETKTRNLGTPFKGPDSSLLAKCSLLCANNGIT